MDPSIIKNFVEGKIDSIWSGCVARVESYNRTDATAMVTPLVSVEMSGKLYELPALRLPVINHHGGGFVHVPYYKKGDLVWLAPMRYNPGPALKGQQSNPSAPHELVNMVVAFGIKKSTVNLPADATTGEGPIVAHEDGDMILKFEKDGVKLKGKFEVTGDVKISGDTSFTGDVSIDGATTTTGDVSTDGDVVWKSSSTPTHGSTHIHGTGTGPSASPNPGS